MDTIYAERADEMLQIHGLSRTPGRIALLKLLAHEDRPVSSDYILKKLANDLDEATFYRATKAFEAEGMIVSYDFGHGHAHYELAHNKPHHHHAVCTQCGRIEDIRAHDAADLISRALKDSKHFTSFSRHSLEFYGRCTSCAAKK